MSNDDGQLNNMPVQPSDDTQPQPAVNFLQEASGAQSRRKFLRAAVISGVAVASVGATAGIAAACQNNPTVLAHFPNNTSSGSGPVTCSLCFEDTNFFTLGSFNIDSKGHNSPGQFYLWFTAQNLPQGKYTMSIKLNPGNHTMMHSPFTYHPGGGNQTFLYQKTKNTADSCPHFASSLPGGEVKHSTTIGGLFCYQTTGSGNVDLQMAVHMDWDGTKITQDTDYYFTGTLKDCDDHTKCTTSALKVTAKYKP